MTFAAELVYGELLQKVRLQGVGVQREIAQRVSTEPSTCTRRLRSSSKEQASCYTSPNAELQVWHVVTLCHYVQWNGEVTTGDFLIDENCGFSVENGWVLSSRHY